MDYLLVASGRCDPVAVDSGATIDLYVKVTFREAVGRPHFGLAVNTARGVLVNGFNTALAGAEPKSVHRSLRRRAWQASGGFEPGLLYANDLDFFLRLARAVCCPPGANGLPGSCVRGRGSTCCRALRAREGCC